MLAIDLSRASLAYARRRAAQLGVANIAFAQADLLRLRGLDRRFAVIVCVGVLHHLANPLAGWEVLADLLQPGGLLKIGLYSAVARRGIVAARALARERGFAADGDGIRSCRRAIMDLAYGQLAREATGFIDFYSTSGCRDLVMHAMEHGFTLPEIGRCLERLGLRFLGMECDAALLERFDTLNPRPDARTDLAAWDRFEQADSEAFKSMYHFWCDRPTAHSAVTRG